MGWSALLYHNVKVIRRNWWPKTTLVLGFFKNKKVQILLAKTQWRKPSEVIFQNVTISLSYNTWSSSHVHIRLFRNLSSSAPLLWTVRAGSDHIQHLYTNGWIEHYWFNLELFVGNKVVRWELQQLETAHNWSYCRLPGRYVKPSAVWMERVVVDVLTVS